jgi:hypothetical protein
MEPGVTGTSDDATGELPDSESRRGELDIAAEMQQRARSLGAKRREAGSKVFRCDQPAVPFIFGRTPDEGRA